MKKNVDKFKVGQMIYYPSINGIAILCKVIGDNDTDYMILVDGRRYFIPKTLADAHAIGMDSERSNIYIDQRLEDPDNKIVYLRYRYKETLIDRLYNWYCNKFKKRPDVTYYKFDEAIRNPHR